MLHRNPSKIKKSPTKDSTHLFLNDSRLEKIVDLPSSRSVKVLYMHNNAIAKIESLDSMVNLTHLYLQRNQITRIENLDSLLNLRKLYLGYNRIHRLENVGHLNRLQELHLECQRLSHEFTFDADSLRALSVRLDHVPFAPIKIKFSISFF